MGAGRETALSGWAGSAGFRLQRSKGPVGRSTIEDGAPLRSVSRVPIQNILQGATAAEADLLLVQTAVPDAG